MPFENEHSSRQSNPNKFDKFRRSKNELGSGIDVIFGIRDDGGSEIQSIRFDRKKFTPQQAAEWLKTHDYKTSIEEAVPEKKSEGTRIETARVETTLTITKAVMADDGTLRWQAVTSDTDIDRTGDHTTLALFHDWIKRATTGKTEDWLPTPRLPFLGLSHYPDLQGFGEGGWTDTMFVDGGQFKARGGFFQDEAHPLGLPMFDAIRTERSLIKRGEMVEKPIRISAAWLDVQHAHGDLIFTRHSMDDKCPMCEQGNTDKIYLKGQLDHWAATRVPINMRTSIALEERSMAGRITRREDASDIIGPGDLVDELDLRARIVGKSEAIVIKAGDTNIGDLVRGRRVDAGLTQGQVAAETSVSRHVIGRMERGETDVGEALLAELSDLLDFEVELPEAEIDEKAGHKKRPAFLDDIDEDDEETKGRGKKKPPRQEHKADDEEDDEEIKAGGKKRRKKDVEEDEDVFPFRRKNETEAEQRPFRPLAGATEIGEAEGFITGQEKMSKALSNWEVLRMVASNIVNAADLSPNDKVKALAEAVSTTGDRIEALKASLADAYLIQQSEAVNEADFDDDEVEENQTNEGRITMTDQEQETTAVDHPADELKAIYDLAFHDVTLSGEQRAEMIQNGMTAFAQKAQTSLTESDGTAVQAMNVQAIKAGVAEAMQPMQESLALIAQHLGNQSPPPVAAPEQKSIAVAPATQVQAAQAINTQVAAQQPPGQSSLTAHIRRSVGIVD